MIDFDTMLIHVGEFGIYQKILFLIQAPFCFFVTWLLFGQVFIFVYPRVYWCEDRCLDFTGLTRIQSRNLTVPFIDGAFDPCQTYDVSEETIENIVSEANSRCQDSCVQDNMTPCEFNAENCQCRQINPSDLETMVRKKRQTNGFGNNWGGRRWPTPGGPPGERQNPNQNPWAFNPGRPNTPPWTFPVDQSNGRPRPPPTNPVRPVQRPQESPGDPEPPAQEPRRPLTPQGPARPQPGTRPSTSAPLPPGRRPQIGPNQNTCSRIAGPSTSSSPSSDSRTRKCDRLQRRITALRSNTSINAENLTAVWREIRTCENWAFPPNDEAFRYPTIVSEVGWWQWCDPEFWITIASAIFFLGAIVGGIGVGYIADNRGRLPALVTANILGCIGGVLSGVFYENYYVFCVFRFISGMGFDNCFTMIYVLVLEYVGPTYRTIAANLSIAIFYTCGTIVLPWLALAIRNWRYFMLAISLPMLFAIIAIFVVPESARWLISQGRIKEATKILRSFAKVNGKNVDEALFVEFQETATEVFEESKKEKKVTFFDGLKKPRIAKNFVLLAIIWSLIALVYNGHSRNILNLGENIYVLFTIASSTEFPADMLVIFTLDRVGRRWLSFISLTLSGVFSVVSAMVPVEMTTLALVMALLSRFWVNVSLNIGLQYAAELLPTVIRAQGVNTIHIMGHVASIVSPFISSMGRNNPVLAGMILGIAAITGGVLSLFLPESLGEDLPNTLEDGEVFGKDQSFWNCPICAKEKPVEEEKPVDEEFTRVQLRNRMRPSIHGGTFRSSIISGSSKRTTPSHEAINLLPSAGAGQGARNKRYTT